MNQDLFMFIFVILCIPALSFLFGKRKAKKDFDKVLFDEKEKNDAYIKSFLLSCDEKIDRNNKKVNEKITSLNKKHKLKMCEAELIIDEAKRYKISSQKECDNIMTVAVSFVYNFKDIFTREHETAKTDIQKILDDSYQFKVKTLLSGITLKNYQLKHEQILLENEKYKELLNTKDFFSLEDNSNWVDIENKYKEKVIRLQEMQDERDAQNEMKRQIKEEKQRQDILEKRQKDAEEEEKRLQDQQDKIDAALASATKEYRKELEAQRAELQLQIEQTHQQYERAKSMAQLTKQGHVYIISNIGSFGENIFKVGMTRRLEPMDRVKELGDASVPFEFDVHAMISCDDAPALEIALHKELKEMQLNKINPRKEFFKVDIDTIISAVKKHHGVVEYTANPLALQYLQSLEIEDNKSKAA